MYEVLKLALVPHPAPNQGPGAYIVGQPGEAVIKILDNNEVIFSDLTVDWKLDEETWVNSPDNEMLWQDDDLRWTVTLPPEEVPFANNPAFRNSLTLLKRPHDAPFSGWEEVSPKVVEPHPSNPAQFYIYAHPLVGDWDISVSGIFDPTIIAWLAAPKHRAANGFVETKWTRPEDDPELRLDPVFENWHQGYSGLGVFPEFTLPPDHVPNQNNHSKVRVEVNLAVPVKDIPADVYFKAMDPDHGFNPSNPNEDGPENANGSLNNYLDGNDVVQEILPYTNPKTYTTLRQPQDNRVGIGGVLADTMKSVVVDETKTSTTFTITAIQPGNNFLVVVTGRPELLPFRIFGSDAVTVIQDRVPGLPPVSAGMVTPILTVWRTLHIERDSMSAPNAEDQALQDHFDDANQDDPHPGDVRNADVAMLAEKFRPANIDVVADLAPYDDKDNGFFMLNLNYGPGSVTEAPFGRAYQGASEMIDVENAVRFWSVQVVGAYEGQESDDFDFVGTAYESWTVGIAAGGGGSPIVFILLEAIRDRATFPGVGTGDNRALFGGTVEERKRICEQRAVVHEVAHTLVGSHAESYNSATGNTGVMSYEIMSFGSDEQFIFTTQQLGVIQSQVKPHGG
ncbi:MAG: hypothetical protein IAF94_17435 [Pirellulaceae bacterium]|nr:hypothetical protein [Pirellulaceae bacterium]